MNEEPQGLEPEKRPPPRVLFLSPQPFFQPRGSPIRVGFDALALSKIGCEVDLVVFPFGEDRAIPGVRLIRAPNWVGLSGVSIGPSIGKALLDVGLLFKAWQLTRRHRYAVIHAVEDAGPIGALLARLHGAKLVFEKHSDPGSYKGGNAIKNAVMWLYERVERFSIRSADAVIGTGPALVEQAKQVPGDRPTYHIFDIPSSLAEADPVRMNAVREAWRRAAGGSVVALYVGSFAAYQGMDLLFQAIPRACEVNPGLRFVIIGGSEVEIAARRADMERAGCGKAVLFPGKVSPEDLPNHLAAADLLLSPRSTGTNTPLKLLDYLKAGRAIVATDHPANRLILDDTTAAFAPAVPEKFAVEILRLAGDPARRAALGRAGLKLTRETYNFGEFARRLQRCYGRLLAPPA